MLDVTEDAKGFAAVDTLLKDSAGTAELEVGLLLKGVEAEAKGFENGLDFCPSGAPKVLVVCSEAKTVLVNWNEQE